MGGYGSGYQGRSKTAVEQCYAPLDVTIFKRYGILDATEGEFPLVNANEDELARMEFWITSVGDYDAQRGICKSVTIKAVVHDWWGDERQASGTMHVEAETMWNSHTRLWWRCPSCDRRCKKLYAQPVSKCYACRVCQNLTYESVQSNVSGSKVWQRMLRIAGR